MALNGQPQAQPRVKFRGILVLETLKLWAFGLTQVRMLFWLRPRVLEMNDTTCQILIPLGGRSRNHLKSMYFGALAAGADCAGGLIAMKQIWLSRKPVALIFKEFKAEFLKRAEGDVVFTCTQGSEISAMVDRAATSPERQEMPLHIVAHVPSKLGEEPVARFTLVLSLKLRS